MKPSTEGGSSACSVCVETGREPDALADDTQPSARVCQNPSCGLRRLLPDLVGDHTALIYRFAINGSRVVPAVVHGDPVQLLGFSAVEIENDLWWPGQIHPEDRDAAVSSLAETVAKGTSRSEYRVQHKGGWFRRLEDRRHVLRSSVAGPVELVGIWRDVSDRPSRAPLEDGSREAESRIRQIAENLNEVVWITSPDRYSVRYVSPAYEVVWGCPRDSLLKDPAGWLTAVHPEDRSRVELMWMHAPEMSCHDEFRVVRPDGTTRWVRTRAFPIRNGRGDVHFLASVAEDITDRKLAETSRRASEERLRVIFHASPIAIGYSTVEGRIVDVNEKMAAFLGYRRDELVDHSVVDLGCWANPEERVAVMARLEHDHLVVNSPARFHTRSGEVRSALFSAQLLESEQEPVFLVMIVDVTAQKSLEAQLHQAERLESVGRLASGIAHDMNNILAPILMAAPLLRMPLEAVDFERTLTTIETSARRGAELVRQLLTLGRGADGEHGPVETALLITEVGKIAMETFPRNIEVVLDAPAGLWCVRGDAAQLHRVLLNLCVNARDAMPDGGRLTIGAANIRLDESYVSMHAGCRPGEYVQITVSDTGIGIPPEVVKHLFEPFFTTKGPGRGTGLGLSTGAAIVKAHGGFINVRSTSGAGSTFEVSVPAAREAQSRPAEGERPAPPLGRGQLVLVVDDEESVRSVLRETLVRHRYNVITASDGADALVAYARTAVEVEMVITDLEMPVMDGTNLARALRRLAPGLPIILSTGLVNDARLTQRHGDVEALQLSILKKPYTAEELLIATHDAIASAVPE